MEGGGPERHLDGLSIPDRFEPGRRAAGEIGFDCAPDPVRIGGVGHDHFERQRYGVVRGVPGHRADRCFEEIVDLLICPRVDVRRIEKAMQGVVLAARSRVRGGWLDELVDCDAAPDATNAAHLAQAPVEVVEVVQRAAADDDVERLVDERQRGGITFFEQHVGDARVPKSSSADVEQGRGEVDSDDLTHVGGELFRDMRGSARDVQHDVVGREGTPARQRAASPGERRRRAREQRHLFAERASDVVIVIHATLVRSRIVTISARPVNDHARSASIGLVDMREGGSALGGSHLYEGDRLVTPWHFHDLHQIEYAARGVVEVETATGRYLLPPQQAVWIPAGIEHRTTIDSAVRTVSVLFDPELVPGPGERVRILPVPALVREMMLYTLRWPVARVGRDVFADEFFRTLAHLVADALDDEAPLCLPTSTDPIVSEAMTYTVDHLDSVTAPDVSHAVGISERTLRRLFRAVVGLSWRDYLLQARLLRAMALLAEPGSSVLEVSIAVGFDNPSAFARAFARHGGETPSAYQRRVHSLPAALDATERVRAERRSMRP